MTPEEAMETGRARRAAPERSFTPPESAALMTLAGREAEASDPSRLIPAREEKAHAKVKLFYVKSDKIGKVSLNGHIDSDDPM